MKNSVYSRIPICYTTISRNLALPAKCRIDGAFSIACFSISSCPRSWICLCGHSVPTEMLTRGAQKRSRAEARKLDTTHLSHAQTLSVSVLLHIMSFIGCHRSLARVQAVCRNWRTFTTSQLDLCWRPLYFSDWEA